MSTTSPNFNFVLATTSDVVNVVDHIANNFNSLDSIIGVVHQGTGEFKSNLTFTSPTFTNATLVGTMTGGSIFATTGSFTNITASGGALTADSFSIGSYSFPATVGATNEILAVQTGNLVFAANAPGTGAATDLGNLASVAINTNLNTFTAGQVTIAELIATSGTLSGMASVSATTGTWQGMTISGTANVDVINVTGGDITAGTFAIGTYSYPNTVGSTGQILAVTTGNLVFFTQTSTSVTILSMALRGSGGNNDEVGVFIGTGTDSITGGTIGVAAWAVKQNTTYQDVFNQKWVKQASIDTARVFVEAWKMGGSFTGNVQISIGTVSANSTVTASSPTWVDFPLDISALAVSSTYDIVIAMKSSNGSEDAILFDSIRIDAE